MLTPLPVVKTCPATPELLRILISRWKLPWAAREYSSPVSLSLRKMVPRSVFGSRLVTSTSVWRISSTVSNAPIVLEISSRSFVSFRFRSGACPAAGFCEELFFFISLQCVSHNPYHIAQLLHLIPGRLFDGPALPFVFYITALQFIAQCSDRFFKLPDLITCCSQGLLKAFLLADPHLFHLVAQSP